MCHAHRAEWRSGRAHTGRRRWRCSLIGNRKNCVHSTPHGSSVEQFYIEIVAKTNIYVACPAHIYGCPFRGRMVPI